jgi:protein phosphatase
VSLSLPVLYEQPPSRPLHLETAARTHPGRLRARNEDELAVVPELGLLVIADGMGGCAAGDVAARMAVAAVREVLGALAPAWPHDLRAALRVAEGVLVAAIQQANADVFAAAQEAPEMKGMGTTIVAALAVRGHVAVAHAGDSRAYLLRGRRLEQLTDDHTVLRACESAGVDLALHPDLPPNALTRAVGAEEQLEVDTRIVQPDPGDVLLLCSDGLTAAADDTEIAAILRAHPDLDAAAEALIVRANENGGPDNVTVILARWTEAGAGHGR